MNWTIIKTWIKNNKLFLFAFVMFITGISLLTFPTLASWQTARQQAKLVDAYRNSVSMVDAGRYPSVIAAADEFNRELAASEQRWTYEQRWSMPQNLRDEYSSLLSIDDSGIMGYLTVEKIDVKLPIFHGTDQKAMDIAVCHVAGSSLPSAQPNTHTVITGHRSRVSSKLFRDMDELEIGDEFSITVLNQKYVYMVDQVQVVVPSDLSKLNIEQGQNYCSLVTCTPYGSESHRMLVRGHFVRDDGAIAVTEDSWGTGGSAFAGDAGAGSTGMGSMDSGSVESGDGSITGSDENEQVEPAEDVPPVPEDTDESVDTEPSESVDDMEGDDIEGVEDAPEPSDEAIAAEDAAVVYPSKEAVEA